MCAHTYIYTHTRTYTRVCVYILVRGCITQQDNRMYIDSIDTSVVFLLHCYGTFIIMIDDDDDVAQNLQISLQSILLQALF